MQQSGVEKTMVDPLQLVYREEQYAQDTYALVGEVDLEVVRMFAAAHGCRWDTDLNTYPDHYPPLPTGTVAYIMGMIDWSAEELRQKLAAVKGEVLT